MAQLGVAEKTEAQSCLVPGQAEPTEPSYIGVTTTFGKTVFIGDEAGLQTLRLGGSALTMGYTWGRAGPGPREVARAILIDATGHEMLAERLCRPFTWEVVSKLQRTNSASPALTCSPGSRARGAESSCSNRPF